jgi:hypothetical protein
MNQRHGHMVVSAAAEGWATGKGRTDFEMLNLYIMTSVLVIPITLLFFQNIWIP